MLKKQNILFVSEYAGFFGGIERYAWLAARMLREAGHSVHYLYQKRARGFEEFSQAFDSMNAEMPSADFSFAVVHKLTDNDLLRTLPGRFGDRLAAVFHDHDCYCPRKYYYTPFGRRNCSRAYSPLLCGLCGMAVSPKKMTCGPFHELCEKFHAFPERFRILHSVPKLVVLSGFMRDNLIRNSFDPARIHLIHPALELPPETARPGNPVPVIVFVGQLIRGKGADSFVRMLAGLRAPYRAMVAGDGNEAANLKNLAAELKVDVEFTGFLPSTETVYSQADLAVLPFRWQEPFGLVGLEAASHGIPVVAFDLGGVREWLRDGETGLLVPAGNEAALTDAVSALLADPVRREEMGAKGRRMAAEEFSKEAFVQAYEKLMSEEMPS